MRWTYEPIAAVAATTLGQALGVSPVLAELLLRNGLTTEATASRFLRPTLSELNDPFLLPHVHLAAERLRQAIFGHEEVVVLGDYDVDGVTSTALLVSVLRRFGLNPRFIVPRRMEDGYGLSRSAIDRALEGGRPRLFIALDCGTNSHAEVAYLIAGGSDVLVVDHHRSKEHPLNAAILVNPHVHGSTGDDAWHHLCTVGLVFKVVHGLVKLLRSEHHPVALSIRLRDYLDLAALGTVADLVPLTGENRVLASFGLRILQNCERTGLQALMHIAGVRPDHGIHPVDISFRLGPRINASGRLADASLSVELLLSDDPQFCDETAQQLDAFNRERQDIERQITEEAERMIEAQFLEWPGIVLYGESWHPGVVGIVAGRVTRKYNRPCIVLGNEGEMAKGSGRSIDRVNLVQVLGTCCERLTSWGGHPMAVGISLPKAYLEEFRLQFAEAVRRDTGSDLVAALLALSAWVTPEDIREKLMDELEQLQPFGQGNPEPVFGVHGVVLRTRPEVFKALHFRFSFEDARGRRLFGVAWKLAHRLPPSGVPLDFAVKLAWNHFNERKLLQLELIDWRESAQA